VLWLYLEHLSGSLIVVRLIAACVARAFRWMPLKPLKGIRNPLPKQFLKKTQHQVKNQSCVLIAGLRFPLALQRFGMLSENSHDDIQNERKCTKALWQGKLFRLQKEDSQTWWFPLI
jgi:hypothetical protein